MRQAYLVSYDVSNPKRLRKVHRLLRGFGDAVQLSVFRCELNHRELVELRRDLAEIIHPQEDQVLLADLGPAEGRGSRCIASLGRAYAPPERVAVVV